VRSPVGKEEHLLVEQARRDPQAFALLYERYVDRIYTYMYYRVQSKETAEDLTAATFEKALEAIPRYEVGGAPFEAWLYRIAHNIVANWYRAMSHRKSVPLEEVQSLHQESHLPEDEVLAAEMKDELLRLIRHMPSEWQEVLILRFAEGKRHAEIGRILGKSETAVKSIYYRTLKSLRSAFRERGFMR